MRLKPAFFASKEDQERTPPDAMASPAFYEKEEGPVPWQKEWKERQESGLGSKGSHWKNAPARVKKGRSRKRDEDSEESSYHSMKSTSGDEEDDEDAKALFFANTEDASDGSSTLPRPYESNDDSSMVSEEEIVEEAEEIIVEAEEIFEEEIIEDMDDDIEKPQNSLRKTDLKGDQVIETIIEGNMIDDDALNYTVIMKTSVPKKSWDKATTSTPSAKGEEARNTVLQRSIPTDTKLKDAWLPKPDPPEERPFDISVDNESFQDEYEDEEESVPSDVSAVSKSSFPWVPHASLSKQKSLPFDNPTENDDLIPPEHDDSVSSASSSEMSVQMKVPVSEDRKDHIVKKDAWRQTYTAMPRTRIDWRNQNYIIWCCTAKGLVICGCILVISALAATIFLIDHHFSPKTTPSAPTPTDSPVMVPTIASPEANPIGVPSPSPVKPPTLLPTSQPEDLLFRTLATLSADGGSALRDPASPQFAALKWLRTPTGHQGTFKKDVLIQRYALATIYYSTNGGNWESNEGWLSSENECEWFSANKKGVCDETNTMIELNLMKNGLGGILPLEMDMLSNLETIHLANNKDLGGTIPSTIANMESLKNIYLESTALTEPFPSDICNLDLKDFLADCYEINCLCCTECFY